MLLLLDLLDHLSRFTLGLIVRNLVNVLGEMRATLLGLPSVWATIAKQDFDLFKSFAAGLSKGSASFT
jgi:hypothetical protein